VHVDDCAHTNYCPTRPHWAAINRAVGEALRAVTLDEMISPYAFVPAAGVAQHPVHG
jgi:DNA-binding IscR family transcriptional regulator